jgi:hypothetical protein
MPAHALVAMDEAPAQKWTLDDLAHVFAPHPKLS